MGIDLANSFKNQTSKPAAQPKSPVTGVVDANDSVLSQPRIRNASKISIRSNQSAASNRSRRSISSNTNSTTTGKDNPNGTNKLPKSHLRSGAPLSTTRSSVGLNRKPGTNLEMSTFPKKSSQFKLQTDPELGYPVSPNDDEGERYKRRRFIGILLCVILLLIIFACCFVAGWFSSSRGMNNSVSCAAGMVCGTPSFVSSTTGSSRFLVEQSGTLTIQSSGFTTGTIVKMLLSKSILACAGAVLCPSTSCIVSTVTAVPLVTFSVTATLPLGSYAICACRSGCESDINYNDLTIRNVALSITSMPSPLIGTSISIITNTTPLIFLTNLWPGDVIGFTPAANCSNAAALPPSSLLVADSMGKLPFPLSLSSTVRSDLKLCFGIPNGKTPTTYTLLPITLNIESNTFTLAASSGATIGAMAAGSSTNSFAITGAQVGDMAQVVYSGSGTRRRLLQTAGPTPTPTPEPTSIPSSTPTTTPTQAPTPSPTLASGATICWPPAPKSTSSSGIIYAILQTGKIIFPIDSIVTKTGSYTVCYAPRDTGGDDPKDYIQLPGALSITDVAQINGERRIFQSTSSIITFINVKQGDFITFIYRVNATIGECVGASTTTATTTNSARLTVSATLTVSVPPLAPGSYSVCFAIASSQGTSDTVYLLSPSILNIIPVPVTTLMSDLSITASTTSIQLFDATSLIVDGDIIVINPTDCRGTISNTITTTTSGYLLLSNGSVSVPSAMSPSITPFAVCVSLKSSTPPSFVSTTSTVTIIGTLRSLEGENVEILLSSLSSTTVVQGTAYTLRGGGAACADPFPSSSSSLVFYTSVVSSSLSIIIPSTLIGGQTYIVCVAAAGASTSNPQSYSKLSSINLMKKQYYTSTFGSLIIPASSSTRFRLFSPGVAVPLKSGNFTGDFLVFRNITCSNGDLSVTYQIPIGSVMQLPSILNPMTDAPNAVLCLNIRGTKSWIHIGNMDIIKINGFNNKYKFIINNAPSLQVSSFIRLKSGDSVVFLNTNTVTPSCIGAAAAQIAFSNSKFLRQVTSSDGGKTLFISIPGFPVLTSFNSICVATSDTGVTSDSNFALVAGATVTCGLPSPTLSSLSITAPGIPLLVSVQGVVVTKGDMIVLLNLNTQSRGCDNAINTSLSASDRYATTVNTNLQFLIDKTIASGTYGICYSPILSGANDINDFSSITGTTSQFTVPQLTSFSSAYRIYDNYNLYINQPPSYIIKYVNMTVWDGVAPNTFSGVLGDSTGTGISISASIVHYPSSTVYKGSLSLYGTLLERSTPSVTDRSFTFTSTIPWNGYKTHRFMKVADDLSRTRTLLTCNLMNTVPDVTGRLCSLIYLYINTTSYGFYTDLESYDSMYLTNHGLDPAGYLYGATSFLWGKPDPNMIDMTSPNYSVNNFKSIVSILGNSLTNTPLVTMYNEMVQKSVSTIVNDIVGFVDKYFNRDNLFSFLSTNIILGNYDIGTSGFYLYKNSTTTGKWYIIPHPTSRGIGYDVQASVVDTGLIRPSWQYSYYQFFRYTFWTAVLKNSILYPQFLTRFNYILKSVLTTDRVLSMSTQFLATMQSLMLLPDSKSLPIGTVATTTDITPSAKLIHWKNEVSKLAILLDQQYTTAFGMKSLLSSSPFPSPTIASFSCDGTKRVIITWTPGWLPPPLAGALPDTVNYDVYICSDVKCTTKLESKLLLSVLTVTSTNTYTATTGYIQVFSYALLNVNKQQSANAYVATSSLVSYGVLQFQC